MSMLGLGTAAAVQGYSPTGRVDMALLQQASDAGIRYFDEAVAYGTHDWLAPAGTRVCVKGTPSQLLRYLAEGPVADTLMVHDGNTHVHDHEFMADLAEMAHRRSNRFGVSTYGVDAALSAILAPWCDVVQVEHSVVNPSVVRAITPHKRPEQEIVVRSVLCRGLLTDAGVSHADPAAAGTVQTLRVYAALQAGMSLPQLAIRFALDTAGVDVVLVGAASAAELREAVAATRVQPLTREQYRQLSAFDWHAADWAHPERSLRAAADSV